MHTLFRWLARLPLHILHGIGGVVGWLAWGLSPTYRRRLDTNARQAGLAPEHRRRAVAEAGRMVMELPRLWLRPPHEPIAPPLQWRDGAELIDAALERGQGLVLMTPHLGCFEICAQAYAERFGARAPLTALYRPSRQPWLREIVERSRARPGLLTAPASLAGVRQMIRALRRGETVGLLPDQVPPEGMGVWAPFFGRPAYTMTLAARLVRQTGATPLLMFGERLPRGEGFAVHVSALPEPLPEPPRDRAADDPEDLVACASVINRAMEHLIRGCPGQYMWGYDRYKSPRATAPAGAAAATDRAPG